MIVANLSSQEEEFHAKHRESVFIFLGRAFRETEKAVFVKLDGTHSNFTSKLSLKTLCGLFKSANTLSPLCQTKF